MLNRLRSGIACLGMLLLSACGGPPYRQTDALAHEQTRNLAIPLSFAPGSAALLPQNYPVLQLLRGDIGPEASVTLIAEGSMAAERAASVSGFLGRDVLVSRPAQNGMLPPDIATLQVDETRLIADACERPGDAVGRNLWPGDDETRQHLIPAGCATSQALLRQVARPSDVLSGQALVAGAAGPFVQAIHRYYDRNDARATNGSGRRGSLIDPTGDLTGQELERRLPRPDQSGGATPGQDQMATVPPRSLQPQGPP
jgi:hypothetical protein